MFVFPAHKLTPLSVRRYVERQVLSGGTSISGEQDAIEVDGGGRWVVEYGDIPIVDADQARLWEAWEEYLSGGKNVCLVPALSQAIGPRPGTVFGRPKRPSDLFYDDIEWPTELRYSEPDVRAETTAAAALRATTLGISVTRGPSLRGGEIFSFAGRMHRVIRPLGGGDFSIRPPLRGAVSAGESLVFDFPLLQARADPAQNFSISLTRGRHGTASIRFLESI